MDRKKELYAAWASPNGYTWTKFAKPAMFAHTDGYYGGWIRKADIPAVIGQLNGGETAVIVDLPGAKGIETGLGLVKVGFRPVPLYNGVHETKNGGRPNAVDNRAVIAALVSGYDVLRYAKISDNAPPAFLLDANRDKKISAAYDIYDNRWSVDFDDIPSAEYIKKHGISKILLWSDKVRDDLKPIIGSYHDAGIVFVSYLNGKQVVYEEEAPVYPPPEDIPQTDIPQGDIPQAEQPENTESRPIQVPLEHKEAVRKFENARFGLMLAALTAAVNLFGMMAVNYEPILWTAPTIMWLTYLWVSEGLGDIIAIIMVIAYGALFFSSAGNRRLIPLAFVMFGIETLILFVYAGFYGFAAYTGYSFWYGVFAFVPPLFISYLLAQGTHAYGLLKQVDYADYSTALAELDRPDGNAGTPQAAPRRRRIFATYRGSGLRGYRGYGGSGFGGYGGGGFGGGYGGGGYGGFGG